MCCGAARRLRDVTRSRWRRWVGHQRGRLGTRGRRHSGCGEGRGGPRRQGHRVDRRIDCLSRRGWDGRDADERKAEGKPAHMILDPARQRPTASASARTAETRSAACSRVLCAPPPQSAHRGKHWGANNAVIAPDPEKEAAERGRRKSNMAGVTAVITAGAGSVSHGVDLYLDHHRHRRRRRPS